MLRLIHEVGDAIEARWTGAGGEVALFRYVYAPRMALRESPKPYFHPLRTLAGHVVTAYRPHDHVWHKGLMLTSAQLSGQNFWGGPTYVRDRGYVQLDNNGRVAHERWAAVDCDGATAALDERLTWFSAAGEPWIAEERRIEAGDIDAAGHWRLDLTFRLRNLRDTPLAFGSPTTEGRPQAGYGGLFWRGPRSFLGGQILAADGLAGPEVMGRAAPWLAYGGKHDEVDAASTIVLLDHPGNPRYPNQWFVRNDPYACASCAFMFDEEYHLPAGETLTQRYRVAIADGLWSREQLDAYAARYQGAAT